MFSEQRSRILAGLTEGVADGFIWWSNVCCLSLEDQEWTKSMAIMQDSANSTFRVGFDLVTLSTVSAYPLPCPNHASPAWLGATSAIASFV